MSTLCACERTASEKQEKTARKIEEVRVTEVAVCSTIRQEGLRHKTGRAYDGILAQAARQTRLTYAHGSARP